MTEEWNECRTYVIYACPYFGARDSAACEAAALQGYLQSKRLSQQQEAATGKNVVRVKYRETPVDLADRRFEYLDTSKSSFINGAWYDTNNSYMVIGLQGIYYHYCRIPTDAWDGFRAVDSFGKHYNSFIKQNTIADSAECQRTKNELQLEIKG